MYTCTYRGSADGPVALHCDADRHEDGAGQTDARQRVQESGDVCVYSG